ncbi:hypothetical protein A2W13_00275 [Candidatus Woesebacteria bacterium RBG_16_36_11]|uniref:Uncharacterized protein n=1 Tax=Candidatus Woesebacteria bacterium RBG_16_36_11 TaxID=1802481 RepID=A0A1F7X731_9BACT|nr:MAG: hypothetical protein A2W13_00275 [Candidatus Woesebacteria bacterium RBG_16_36_11]
MSIVESKILLYRQLLPGLGKTFTGFLAKIPGELQQEIKQKITEQALQDAKTADMGLGITVIEESGHKTTIG